MGENTLINISVLGGLIGVFLVHLQWSAPKQKKLPVRIKNKK